MAKEKKSATPQTEQTPQTPEPSSTTSPVQTQSEEEEGKKSTPPNQIEEKPDLDEQKMFFDEFDKEDTEEFETEGAPVKTAETKPIVSAQSDETDDEAQFDAEGKPVVKQVPPVEKTVEPEVKKTEEPPAQPKKVEALTGTEEPVVAQTPEQAQQRFVEWRTQTEDLLAKHHYALKPEDVDELDTNPGEFISKIAAKVYLDSVTAVLTQITQHLPRMVQQVNEQSSHAVTNEEQFYSRWSKLKEHADTVLRVGAVYRQLNPAASMEDFINEVGAQTMVAMRIPPEEMQQQVNAKSGNGVQQAAPFKPAASSPPGGPPIKPEKNVFSDLNDEFDEDLGDN